ncbi:MAG: hypothetical protein NZ108_08795, partial [Bacteroidia bacterium]|nr:hypothetical protein [Bacteroidia bacterium]
MAILVLLFILIDLYVFQGFRTLIQSFPEKYRSSLQIIYWMFPILLFSVSLFFAAKYSISGSPANVKLFPYFFGLFVLFYVPKLFWLVLLVAEDVFRLGTAGIKLITSVFSAPSPTPEHGADLIISRSQFLSQLGLITASIPFGSIAYGLIKGKYDYQIKRETIYFPN